MKSGLKICYSMATRRSAPSGTTLGSTLAWESGGPHHPIVGRPDEEIVRLAEELGTSLIVLESRSSGPSGMPSWAASTSTVVRQLPDPGGAGRGDRRPAVLAPCGTSAAEATRRLTKV